MQGVADDPGGQPVKLSTSDAQRGLLVAAENLVRLSRDLPRLRAAFAAERLGYPTSTCGSGGRVNGGQYADPVLRLAEALLDGKIDDRAETDSCHLDLHIREVIKSASEIYLVYARWMPELAHVEACANPYGCPDGRPAAAKPRRKGLCLPCYSWEYNHDGEHRRTSRNQAA